MKKDYSTLLWYVYTVRYPSGIVFYVGKGKGRRIDMHERQALTLKEVSIKSASIIDVYLDGKQVIKQIEAWFRVDQHACVYEAMLIEAYGLSNLTNRSVGTKKRKLAVSDTASQYYTQEEYPTQEILKKKKTLPDLCKEIGYNEREFLYELDLNYRDIGMFTRYCTVDESYARKQVITILNRERAKVRLSRINEYDINWEPQVRRKPL